MSLQEGVEGTTTTAPTVAPVSTEEFHVFKSSIDTRFDELKAIILSMQNNTSTSVTPPPTNTTTNVVGFVDASKDPSGSKDAGTEKKPVEEDGDSEDFNDNDSFHTIKPKHAKANGTGQYSAVPPGPSYTSAPLAHLIMLVLEVLLCLIHLASLIGNF